MLHTTKLHSPHLITQCDHSVEQSITLIELALTNHLAMSRNAVDL